MNQLLKLTTISLTNFLSEHLPKLSAEWWEKLVISKLSYQQQRLAEEKGIKELVHLDLAASLRVLDQNWFDLRELVKLPYEGRNWVKEMQNIRNKWAHISAEEVPSKECYRDADTMARFLEMLKADSNLLEQVESYRQEQFLAMAPRSNTPVEDAPLSVSPDSELATKAPTNSSSFTPGSMVALRSKPNEIFPVIEVVSGGKETAYKVFHNNSFANYYESQLQEAITPVEVVSRMNLSSLHAYLTSLQLLSPSTSSLFSLRSGRINFVPYQYRPVLKMIRADRPRLLIADEVGVGKTIESGLLIKELRARMDIQSVLIICPKALVAERKWELEMKRFDEQFTPLNGSTLRHCIRETYLDGEWPAQYSKAIIPTSLFNERLLAGQSGKQTNRQLGLLELDPPPEFDLVIVDEVHHIRNSDTHLHRAVRYFCDNAQAVVFLSATPVQLGSNDLYTLLNVLRPDLVIDQASFQQMSEPNPMINEAINLCRLTKDNWQQEAREMLDKVAQTSWGERFIRETPAFQSVCDTLDDHIAPSDDQRVSLIHTLEELYTFSSLINRTRRRDIGGFTTRKPQTLDIPFTDPQKKLHDDLLELIADILEACHGAQNVKFMMTTIRRQAASCIYGLAPLMRNILNHNFSKLQEAEIEGGYDFEPENDLKFITQAKVKMEALIQRGENLDSHDPKVEAFIKVLSDKTKTANNKALVFSTFRHTLSYLEVKVQDAGLRYGIIHGDVPDFERANLRLRFKLPKEDFSAIDVLLSSEVGCEGLDFQFCDLIVNYDLPWNPMRVEQRIGRIDRYGQKSETVSIVNMITPETVDADIYERCLLRIGVFNSAIGGSEAILGNLTQEIKDIAESYELSQEEREARLNQLSDNQIRQVHEEQKLEDKQADLFGLNVPKQGWEKDIADAESFWLSPSALQQCVQTYLQDLTGSTGHLMGEQSKQTLRLNRESRDLLLADLKLQPRSSNPERRQWEKWLKAESPTLSVTFDQETAADYPEITYLNVLHPLLKQAAGQMRQPEAVQVHIQASTPSIPAGTYPFAIYRWKKCGAKADETLKAVTLNNELEDRLMKLIPSATEADTSDTLSSTDIQQLEDRQYAHWRKAQANHIADNFAIIEQRIQSLTTSHDARCKLLGDQIDTATNSNIIRMKQSQLNHAQADFNRRKEDLDQAANSGDILSSIVAMGTITICNS